MKRQARVQAKPQAKTKGSPIDLAGEDESDNGDFVDALRSEFGEEFGPEWFMELYKIAERGERGGYIRKAEIEELSNIRDWLAGNVGAGTYSVVLKEGGKIRSRKTVRIFVPGLKTAPVLPAPAAPPPNETQQLLQALKDQNATLLALLQRQAPSIAPTDPFALTDRMMATMATMMQTMGGAKSDSTVEAMRIGIDIAQKAAGGGDGTNIYDLLREGLAALPSAVEMIKSLPRPQPAPPPLPAPAIAPQVPAPADPFVEQIRFLVERARAGNHPAVYAQVLADAVPDQTLDALLTLPDPVEILVSACPEAAPHRDWFGELVAALKEIGQDESPGQEGTTLAGDGVNSASTA